MLTCAVCPVNKSNKANIKKTEVPGTDFKGNKTPRRWVGHKRV